MGATHLFDYFRGLKKLKLILILFIGLLSKNSFAQYGLNPAVDTIHNDNNRQVIRTLFKYFDLRFHEKDASVYWTPSETQRLKAYDLYAAHSLYRIPFDDIIVLGITQPQDSLFRVKVLFDYIGTDKKKTIFSINDYYLKAGKGGFKFTNALFVNMQTEGYVTVSSPGITYHFPAGYKYDQLKIDSANLYLGAIERFFNKTVNSKLEYVTSPTCESVYAMLGNSYMVGTLSSSSNYCGFFDKDNQLIITSGDEFYRHELLRTLNVILPQAPDLVQSGLTSLWGGSRNMPIIYHLKRLYPYIQQHPDVLNDIDNFYYFDDETVPGFVFQAVVMNYILKKGGKAALLKAIENIKPKDNISSFLKEQYHITDVRAFFLKEFDYYRNRNNLEFDDLLKIR